MSQICMNLMLVDFAKRTAFSCVCQMQRSRGRSTSQLVYNFHFHRDVSVMPADVYGFGLNMGAGKVATFGVRVAKS